MANNYFTCKHFSILQDISPFKVGTDGVLLGAWAEHDLPNSILDIGTGTGLIALMLVQRYGIATDALDINTEAYKQAAGNFQQSKWAALLTPIHANFMEFVTTCTKKYDLIVCNPPYFNNSLHNPDKAKAASRHSTSLPHDQLLQGVQQILSEQGAFCLVLPAYSSSYMIEHARPLSLFCTKKLWIVPTPEKKAMRVLMKFQRKEIPLSESEIIIEEKGRHGYSEEYKRLTKDFYLAF